MISFVIYNQITPLSFALFMSSQRLIHRLTKLRKTCILIASEAIDSFENMFGW